MAKQYKNIHLAKYYRDYLVHEIRPDGREFHICRPIIINMGSVTTANGSAVVKIGNTTVVCGIKAELAKPKPEFPNLGYIIPNVDLPPLCSSKFRPGPPCDQAQVTSCIINDIIKYSGIINLEDLCIIPDCLVWVLYVDLICLNHDGALTDACVFATISALKTVMLPEIIYDPSTELQSVNEDKKNKLNIKEIPIAATYAVFENLILTDPTNEEESLCTGIITIVVSDSKLCLVHKPGGSSLLEKDIEHCIIQTKNRIKLSKELILSAYNNHIN